MAVSFFKHKKSLIDAYKGVLDEKSDTDWALFTYEGKDNELKVAGTGEDGLEELESEFNSSKIMYAFIRVRDPKTSLNKFIFLHWQGEGAPANRKGACANHVRDVERFFKGAHITINARNEDDVTPEQIMQYVSRASASTYAFDKVNQDGFEEPAAPVGSVYKRVNPSAEIKSTRKETYWEKQEREEEARKKEEQKRKLEERKKYEQDVLAQEKESTQRRSQWEKNREREINEKMRAAKLGDDRTAYREQEKAKWEKEQREFDAESERGRKRSESIEKAAEAAHLVQKRDANPRTLWEQRISEANRGPPASEPRKKNTNQEHAATSYQPGKPESPGSPLEQYGIHQESTEDEHPAFDSEPAYATEEQPTFEVEGEQAFYGAEQQVLYQDDQQQQYGATYDEVSHGQASDGQYSQQQYGEGYEEQRRTDCRARALYDYQAEDETEISFDPDDIIRNIIMVDEGWWRGTGPDEREGLFPANYVELQ